MKWISLAIITLLIAWFWPASHPESKSDEEKKPSVVFHFSQQNPERRLQPNRTSKKHLSEQELGSRITTLWGDISDDPRDPKVVEFIRLLREFGKRDELAAFALLDGLAVGRHTERWLMARVAVAGGWAIRDPAEASKALFNDGAILPKDFEVKTGISIAMPDDLPQPNPFAPKSTQVAILRQASYIFKAWSEIDHEAAIHFTNSLAKDQTSAVLLRMLRRHLILDRVRGGSTAVNRSSIDAILSNPQRTPPYSTYDFGAEIHGDTLDSGEPAFTFEEWAARNPELAKESLVPKETQHSTIYSATPLQAILAWSNHLIAGLARTDPDYIGLLELSAPENHFHTAYQIARSVGRNADDEDVWQLDGRESSWTLNFGQREKAMLDLIEEGNFSDEERAALKTKMEGEATRFDFIYEPPELPNKKPD